MASNNILAGINNAIPSILSQLETINRQINFATKAPNAISENQAKSRDGRVISDSRGNPELDFKPIESEIYTGITASKRNPKPFIIGFIPPDNPINFVPIKAIRSSVAAIEANQNSNDRYAHVSGSIAAVSGLEENTTPEFRRKLIAIAEELGTNPDYLAAVMSVESGRTFDPAIRNPQGGATGLIQFMPATARNHLGTTTEELSQMSAEEQLDYVKKYYEPFKGRLKSVDDVYLATFMPYYVGKPRSAVIAQEGSSARSDKSSHTQGKVYDQNKGLARGGVITVGSVTAVARGRLSVATRRVDVPAAAPKVDLTETQRNPRNLMTYGQRLGPDSVDKLDGRWGRTVDPDGDRRKYTDKQVDALRAQIENIKKIPPLLLLINPSEFNRSYEHTTDSSVKTRHGHIVHMWIEKPFKISSSGVTAGQYVVDASGRGGLTTERRVHSLSYANLSSLVGIYKNNGRIFIGDEANPANRGVQLLAFTVFVYYDEHIYLGSFDDFGVIDSSDKPFNMSYSMKFNVRYDMAVPTKPQSQYRETDYRISRGIATRATGE
jgi:hypothetical protein